MPRIVGYTYRADNCCDDCTIRKLSDGARGATAEWWLDRIADHMGIDRGDEMSFDSDRFPKVIWRHQIGDEDCCGVCNRLLRYRGM